MTLLLIPRQLSRMSCVQCMFKGSMQYKPWHEISNNVLCATSKASDQPAHMSSLIWAFASRLNILWMLSYWLNSIWRYYAYKEAAEAGLSLHLSKYHIVWNHMSRLILFSWETIRYLWYVSEFDYQPCSSMINFCSDYIPLKWLLAYIRSSKHIKDGGY